MADPREQYDNIQEAVQVAIEAYLDRIWTMLPVQVAQDSQDGFVCKLQPTIQGRQLQPPQPGSGGQSRQAAQVQNVNMTDLGASCPVQFVSGGGFTITVPIKQNDEGMAIFAARCIDTWWDKGGIQPQAEYRRHDLSDACYIPGIRSKPRKLNPQPSTTSLQIRTDDGKTYIEIDGQHNVNIVCSTCTVKASTKVYLQTPLVECSQDMKVDGKLTVGGTVSAGDTVSSATEVQVGGDFSSNGGTAPLGDGAPLNVIPSGISLSWTSQTQPPINAGDPPNQPGTLMVSTTAPTPLSQIGQAFKIAGALNIGGSGGNGLLNQVFKISTFLNPQNFMASLPALVGQIGQIGGNPVLSALVKLSSHVHLGVQPGLGDTQRPQTGI